MEPEVMITIALLTGLVGSVLMHTAGFVLAAWVAGHCLRAMIVYVPRVKKETSIRFRISYWLMLISLALATIAWLFWIPNALTMFSDHPVVLVVLSIVFYLAPLAIPYATWGRLGT